MQDERNIDRPRNLSSTKLRARVSLSVFWIVLGTVAVIFSAYELIERTWLDDVDMRLLHGFHIVRGVGTCIIVALFIVWYILRAGPSIFPSESSDIGEPLKTNASDRDRLVHFSSWFIRMRWVACIVAAVLTFVMIKVLKYLEDEAFVPLVILILCIAATNILYMYLLRQGRFLRRLAELQIGTDLVLLTAMLHFSGGIENPMFLAYVFHVIIGGILLKRRECYAIIVLACALFAVLALAEMSGLVKHYTLLVFPHGEATEESEELASEGGLDSSHKNGDGQHMTHAAHDVVYVSSVTVFQCIVLALTGYFTVTIMDQLRADHKRLVAIRQRLERVLQATGVGFSIVDKGLRPVWMNDQIRGWLDLSDETLTGPQAHLVSWMDGREGAAARTFSDGIIRSESRQLIDAGGNKRFFDTTVAPLVDSAGDIYEVVELTQEITEKKILENQALQAGKMAALGMVAAGVAHEVGNPLASISTRLSLLEEDHSESFLKESVKLLQAQIERISRIVREISQIARPAKKQWAICRINELVGETLTLLRFHSEATAIRIETELSDTIPDLMGVQDELTQVFLNLGLNAVEAMGRDGILTARTYARDGEIFVEFADTGPGLRDDIRSRVFEPFFTSKQGGSGLGLSIAHRIVTGYGGWIEAANREEGGATFTVVLPVRKPA